MPFTAQERERIVAAIREKAPQFSRCSICGHSNWALQDQLVIHVLQDNPKAFMLGGPSLPCVVIVCANCGNTYFLNAMVLGLGDLVERGG
jgi:hypothetical protein